MTSTQILAVVAVVAVVAIIVGVAMQWGAACALIVGGTLTLAAVGVLLYDPDSRRP